MKSYVLTTGVLFALIVVAHIARMISESHALATNPIYLLITLISASLAFWAWRIFRQLNVSDRR